MPRITKGIPKEIAVIYKHLYNEVCWLDYHWLIYCQLYTNEPNVKLLNESAPSFFRICQDIFADYVLLTISRLTDPHQTFKKDNLSFAQLVNRVDGTSYPALKKRLEKHLTKLAKTCEFARKARNKRIAHNDLTTKLKVSNSLMTISIKNKIDMTRKGFHKLLNEVEEYFQQVPVSYDYVITYDDGETLMKRLNESKSYRADLRRKRGQS
jgi:hypothetical protein